MNSKIRKTRISGILSLMLVLMLAFSMMCSAITPVAAVEGSANEKVTAVSDSLMQIRMVYKDENLGKIPLKAGTCFLINENTVLTSSHVVHLDNEYVNYVKEKVANFNKNNFSYEVVVSDDVTIPSTIKKESQVNDFAIVSLNETIGNKTPAVLGDSEAVIPTTYVYALGFPGDVTDVQSKSTYTSKDTTITTGQVSKIGEFGGIDSIQHSATLGPGNSGGPLVDENGYVLGINRGGFGGTDSDKYLYAVRIQQIMDILDALVIPYTKADSDPAPIEETTVEEATTAVPAEVTTEATEPTTQKTEEPAPMDTTKLIIIIAIVVLVIILAVIIIMVVVGNKKKSANKIQTPPRGNTVMPVAPQTPQVPSNRPSQPPYPPQSNFSPMQNNMQGSAPTMPSNEGAGETSVLNDGAGETTVLGNQSAGYFLVRKNNGEKININKPEFVIGKERRRVDYCINDNNSVSRAHAKIRVRAGRCYISDLGSTNCTFVNGSKLSPNQEVILSKGDKIKISDEEFEFLG